MAFEPTSGQRRIIWEMFRLEVGSSKKDNRRDISTLPLPSSSPTGKLSGTSVAAACSAPKASNMTSSRRITPAPFSLLVFVYAYYQIVAYRGASGRNEWRLFVTFCIEKLRYLKQTQ